MIGEAADLDKQLQILNRTVRWSSRGLWIEADPRHVKEVIRALGLEGASPAPTPGVAANWETRDHVPCGRGEAEILVPRPARYYVRHYEAVLKDVSAGRTRLEGHEESGSVPRWKATGLGVCLNGRPIQVPCTPPQTRIGQETDNQESRSAGREAPDQGLDEAAKHCCHPHRPSKTVRWQPCSNRVDGSSGVLPKSRPDLAAHRLLSMLSRTGLDKAKHIEIQHLSLQEAVRSRKLTVE